MSVATACALAPGLALRPRNPQLEHTALEELAAWAGRFTPNLSLDVPDTVLLEVAASLRLFGGAAALLRRVAAGCDALGYRAVSACAPTPLAARLLARAGIPAILQAPGDVEAALAPLPLALLDCAPQARETLAAIGAKTLGDCLRLPRAGLAQRCGTGLIGALDAALGRVADPRRWFVPPPTFSSRIEPLTPVEHTEAVLFAARRLLAGLEGFLVARQAGIERYRLRLEHEQQPATLLTLSLAGVGQEAGRFLAILRERLARLELRAAVSAIGVEADDIRPLAPANRSLFADAQEQRSSCTQLVERLRARLGDDAISGVRAVAAHRPEFAWDKAEPGTRQQLEPSCSARPFWLLDPPQPIPSPSSPDRPEARAAPACTLLSGPERIESGWWDGGDAARDYFVARGNGGELLWLFHERRPPHGWYVHGLFG